MILELVLNFIGTSGVIKNLANLSRCSGTFYWHNLSYWR